MEVTRGDVIRRGSEAVVHAGTWEDMKVVIKTRISKGYRHPSIDLQLRSERTRHEARMLRAARDHVWTPRIIDIDLKEHTIMMEMIEGPVVRDLVLEITDGNLDVRPDGGRDQISAIGRSIGAGLAKLHAGGLAHGDPTTSNMIYHDGEVWFIDLSLGSRGADIEEKAVDLRLLREAVESTHPGTTLFDDAIDGYLSTSPDGDAVVEHIERIDSRGRYRRRPAV